MEMDDKKIMDMVEKFTQSSTMTAMNVETMTRALDSIAATLSAMSTDRAMLKETSKRIEEDLEDIRKAIAELSKDEAVRHQRTISYLKSVRSEEKDIKKTVSKILIEVTKIAAIASLVVALLKGGTII